jgi:hypothetical protein
VVGERDMYKLHCNAIEAALEAAVNRGQLDPVFHPPAPAP